ncbi:MAG TPA: polymer-forming cytoskeletal protein [Gemmatimonadetes bacterium]|nr:polymer-forming cytoskeletal protein [Gemmatimonadota bacterium]HIN77493.1 polymer-forming cytoskeletal protein [Gemmatimonadota bacterium]
MARERSGDKTSPESVISIIGPGMTVVGDCETEGSIRIEGRVNGNVRAGKAVVVGRDAWVKGDITTQDAVLSGRVTGIILAGSRLELQATCRIEGDVHARRLQLQEGAILNGTVNMRDSSERGEGSSGQEPGP